MLARFITEPPQKIPAFAGMTKSSAAFQFLHTLFRGNDEVLFDGDCLLQCRHLGDPSVTMRTVRFLHTLENGNPEAAVRYTGPVFLAETPRQIPAFAGMTSVCNAARFLHMLESGNPEAVARYTGPVFLAGTPRQIPAFAGMTKSSSVFRFLHTLFRGHDEGQWRLSISSHDLSRNKYAGTATSRLESQRPFILSTPRKAVGNPGLAQSSRRIATGTNCADVSRPGRVR